MVNMNKIINVLQIILDVLYNMIMNVNNVKMDIY